MSSILKVMSRHAAALLTYLGLAIAYTWPLVLRMGSAVPHDLGDPLLTTWILWWNSANVPLTESWWNGGIFFPGKDALTLSEHRLGLSVITSPLIWFGASPLLSHNVAFMMTFVLSAVTAYALCFALTRNHGAAFVGGLVYGFNPFRAEHLPHLELLASYSLPLALLALHRWRDTQRDTWLVVLAGALTLQAFTSGYYFVFFGVLVGLWLLWYRPLGRSAREYIRLGLALGAPLVLMSPVLLHYSRAHAALGLSRTITEIEFFSADLAGLLARPATLALWPAPPEWRNPEGAIYPGFFAVALVAAALLLRRREAAADEWPPWARNTRAAVLLLTLCVLVAAATPLLAGPVAAEIAGLRVSITDAYKPFSVALLLAAIWLLTTRPVRASWKAHSHLGFYALATIAMWTFALGPTGRFLGERFWYKAPYSWLMELPGIDSAFRVPARFAMLAALTLAPAAACAFARLAAPVPAPLRTGVLAIASALVLADSWIRPLPLPAPPATRLLPADAPADAVLVELPLGAYEDAAAMYRAIEHRRPIVNGLSGYHPPHYIVLHGAMEDARVDALRQIASLRPLIIDLDTTAAGADLVRELRALPSTRVISHDATRDVILLDARTNAIASEIAATTPVPIATINPTVNAADATLSYDGEHDTFWMSDEQTGDEELVVDVGTPYQVSGVSLALGGLPAGFPRALAVEVSTDGLNWREVWRGETAAMAFEAALRDPRQVEIRVEFSPHNARFVRLRQLQQSHAPWVVAELKIWN